MKRRRPARRSRESYVSRDPAKRAAQLSNLRSVPPVGPGRPAMHGGYAAVAREQLDAKAREVFAALAEDAPVRDGDGGLPAADAVPVRLLAEVLCRLDSVSAFLSARGWQDDVGEVRPAVEVERRLRQEALDLSEALGMTPRSRAKLGLALARTATLADEIADGAQAWQRAAARLDVVDDAGEDGAV